MRTLILGGTAWLGAGLAETAVGRGHEVTCLARGSRELPRGVAFVRADRTEADAYAQVADQQWDVVFDVSRQPGQVRSAVQALRARTRHFVFVSSGNVYADHRAPGQGESSPLLPALEGPVMESMDRYGEAKVACEQHVLGRFGPDACLIARVGLIGGPGDPFDRSVYWPHRFARPATDDGAVLVPDSPAQPTQVIDVRDLAGWLVEAGAARGAGGFNATGETVALADHLELAREVAGHCGPVVRADPDWLLAQGVQPWMGPRSLPLWLTDPDWQGFNARASDAARRAGLVTRPLTVTLADTLAWALTRDPDRDWAAGLSGADERALIAAWRTR